MLDKFYQDKTLLHMKISMRILKLMFLKTSTLLMMLLMPSLLKTLKKTLWYGATTRVMKPGSLLLR